MDFNYSFVVGSIVLSFLSESFYCFHGQCIDIVTYKHVYQFTQYKCFTLLKSSYQSLMNHHPHVGEFSVESTFFFSPVNLQQVRVEISP